MLLTFAEDWSSTISLDTQLTGTPDTGMYLNSGVHPSIRVENLLSFLPNVDFTFAAYAAGTTYGKYEDTRLRTDIVEDSGVIYQSISSGNVGNTPASSPNEWLPTNIESIRLKTFVWESQDNAINQINLTRRLVDSQYLYNVAELRENPTQQTLPNDYAAWVFEPKGSDYVKIRINQFAFQGVDAGTYNLYVLNQGQLIDTLTITIDGSGTLSFSDINDQPNGYEFIGKGKWLFAFDTSDTDVWVNGSSIDPLKFEGFVPYTAVGIGATPQDATWTFGVTNNGMNFNITAFLDASVYLNNNLRDFGPYLQAAWELDCLRMFVANPNSRSNREERIVGDRNILVAETMELDLNSVARKHKIEKKAVYTLLGKTLDTQLKDKDDKLEVNITSV